MRFVPLGLLALFALAVLVAWQYLIALGVLHFLPVWLAGLGS